MADLSTEAGRSRPDFPEAYGIASAPEGMLSWADASDRLTTARNYWVSTTRPDGRPHAAPVWGLWLGDTFYFSTDPSSRKGRNIAANPNAVVHLESGDDVVILEGILQHVADPELLTRFVDAYDVKYGFRVDTDNPSSAVFMLRPLVAHAWMEHNFPQSATRWILKPPGS
ncbi:MAG: pyridoxamine 5'-phosphate oxidase-related FMN-binding protein [Chloroflexi bacterium]|nr:pyridoxamine 5'-phosphate oxidase-related FMN-binding protein [Chloroflexota bacterium]